MRPSIGYPNSQQGGGSAAPGDPGSGSSWQGDSHPLPSNVCFISPKGLASSSSLSLFTGVPYNILATTWSWDRASE